MPDWMWLVIGPGGLLGGGFAAWRYHRKCQVVEKAISTGKADIVDATGRALAPVAGATRDVRARQRQRKAAGQQAVRQLPRQSSARPDDTAVRNSG